MAGGRLQTACSSAFAPWRTHPDLAHRPRNEDLSRHVSCRSGRTRARFHPRHRPGRPGCEAAHDRRYPVSAGAQRLPAHRPRQVDLPEFRGGGGVRRPLPPALRRHQSHQGGAGVYRRDRARRALARLRLGQAPLPRVGLFRAALPVGRGPDPRRQGLCRRSVTGRDAHEPRHADRAGQEQPVPRPRPWRRTSICSAACGRASFRTARACCAPRSI